MFEIQILVKEVHTDKDITLLVKLWAYIIYIRRSPKNYASHQFTLCLLNEATKPKETTGKMLQKLNAEKLKNKYK